MRPPDFPVLPDTPEEKEELLEWANDMTIGISEGLRDVYAVLRNGVDFEENVDGVVIDVTTPGVADTEFSVTHGLERVPDQFVVLSVDKAAVIYKGTTAWTSELAYLKANAATVALKVAVL